MTHSDQTDRALNQLASLLAGRDAALATNTLSDDPVARIDELLSLTTAKLRRAAATGDQGDIKGATRTLESLGNLRILAAQLFTAA